MFSYHSNLNSRKFPRLEFECFSDLTSSVELSNIQCLNVFESVEFDLIEFQCDQFHFRLAYGVTLGHETQARQGPPPREGTVAPFMYESEHCARASPALFVRHCFGLLVIVIPRPLR